MNRIKILISSLLSIACLLSISYAALPTKAQDTEPAQSSNEVVLGLFPAGGQDGDRFEFVVEPGQSEEMTAVLVSFGNDPVRLRSYASHIVPIANGGMQIPPFDTEADGTVSWIEYPTEELVLNPSEPLERTIKVTVPDGTPPGQYVNAVALETLDPIVTEGSPFAQYYRKVVSVYITVPGDVVVDFVIDDPVVLVNRGQAAVQMTAENSGNVRVDLEGTLTLRDQSGAVVHEGNVFLGPIYMGQSVPIQVPLANVPPAGDDYTVAFTFSDKTSSVNKSSEQMVVSVPEDTATSADLPIHFANVTVEPNADPIVFVNVSVDVVLNQTAHRSTVLTLSVFHDGEHVEDFVLADNLSLPIGTTSVSQRYLPATDWESGTYTFSLKLESKSSDQISLLLEEESVATLEVP